MLIDTLIKVPLVIGIFTMFGLFTSGKQLQSPQSISGISGLFSYLAKVLIQAVNMFSANPLVDAKPVTQGQLLAS